MSLPMNTMPVYTLTIPSTNKPFKYRPFVVKDQKALLIAQQSEDNDVMLDTIRDVVKSCAQSPIDPEELASFDLEYIFANLRSVSVGEIVDLVFQCDTCTDEKARIKVPVNLMDVKVQTFEGHKKKILLFEDVGVMMKYPTIQAIKNMSTAFDDVDSLIELISDCIDYIYKDDEIFPIKEQKKEDVIEFINNLTAEQFKKIESFFRTMPQLRIYLKYDCPVCNKHHNKYLEGLRSFF